MIKYGLKNLFYKKVEVVFISVFIAFILGSVFAANSAGKQVEDGYNKLTKNYDIIIGPKGSSAEIVFSTLNFSKLPENTLPIEIYDTLDVEIKIPIAVGDTFGRGSMIVGTTVDFLDNYTLAIGKEFSTEKEVFDIVIGYNVAKEYNLHIGSKIVASHDAIHIHDDEPYMVVGILEPTTTNIDNTCFTYIENIWDMHEHDEFEEENETNEEHHKSLTGILVKTKSLQENYNLLASYKESNSVTVVTINSVIRNLLSSTETTLVLIRLLVVMIAIIGIMAIIILINNYRMVLLEDIKAIKTAGRNPLPYITIQVIVITALGLVGSVFCKYIILLKIADVMKEYGIVIQTLLWR